MEARHGYEHVAPVSDGPQTQAPAVEAFVRFCYHRRRVGWPELYDEMCAVAARSVFRGWGFSELADQGIRFTLSDLPGLAAVAAEVSRDERERTRRLRTSAKTVDLGTAVCDVLGEDAEAPIRLEAVAVAPDEVAVALD